VQVFVASSLASSLAWPFIMKDPTAFVTAILNFILLWSLWRGSQPAWWLFTGAALLGGFLNIVTGGPVWITVFAAGGFALLLLSSTRRWLGNSPG